MNFSETLKKLRKEKRITQTELAEALDISVQRISLYENGREPDYEILIKIADYFDVLVDYLIGRTKYSRISTAMSVQKLIDSGLYILNYQEIESEDPNLVIIERDRIDSDRIERLTLPTKDHELIKQQLNSIAEILYKPYE